jgi:hypothetical protein
MYRKLWLLVILLSSTHLLFAQQHTRYIRFREEDPGQRLQHYHVVTVTDDRADTSTIGELKTGIFGKKNTAVNFEQGTATAVSGFIHKSFGQDTSSTAVELHITELQIQELAGGLRTKIEAVTTVAFSVKGTKITEYRGRGEVQTMGDVFRHIEDLVRQNLRNSLLEFDNWWGKNKGIYSSDAPVTLTVTIEPAPKDTNLLGYSPARPLTPHDFRATPDELSRAAAGTADAIAVRYSTDLDNGLIRVHAFITPYFDKMKSWYLKKYHNNAQVLIHEQGHFDIAAIKACELADTMRQQKLTKSNYLETLELIVAQKQQEMSTLQKQYDTETRHGMNHAMQDKWNKLVKELLARLACYR